LPIKRQIKWCYILQLDSTKNQTFHYSSRTKPKRVTSLWCPTPCHSAKATQLLGKMLKRWRTVRNAV